MSGKLRAQSVALATAVHSRCVRQQGVKDGGVRSTGMAVPKELLIPGIVVQTSGPVTEGPALVQAVAAGLEHYRQAAGRKPRQDLSTGQSR